MSTFLYKKQLCFFFKSPIFLQNRWFFENLKTSKSSIFLIIDRNPIIFGFLYSPGLVLCVCKFSDLTEQYLISCTAPQHKCLLTGPIILYCCRWENGPFKRVHFTEVVPNNQLFLDIYALKNENCKMRNSQFFVRSFDFSSTKLVTKHFSATKKRWKTYANRFFEVFCRENTEIRYAFCKLGDLRLHDKFMDTWLFCEGNTIGMCTQNTSGLTKTFC